jgi:WXG100 protein secretion system (Wss), protein YukD
MSFLTIEVWDATGSRKSPVEVPDDVAVKRILVVLIEKLNMPRHAPDGQLLSYKFHHQASRKQLLDEQTLAEAGVREGDVLRLQPEITAGGGDHDR